MAVLSTAVFCMLVGSDPDLHVQIIGFNDTLPHNDTMTMTIFLLAQEEIGPTESAPSTASTQLQTASSLATAPSLLPPAQEGCRIFDIENPEAMRDNACSGNGEVPSET